MKGNGTSLLAVRHDTETTEKDNKKKKNVHEGEEGGPVSSHANLSGALESRRFPERRQTESLSRDQGVRVTRSAREFNLSNYIFHKRDEKNQALTM